MPAHAVLAVRAAHTGKEAVDTLPPASSRSPRRNSGDFWQLSGPRRDRLATPHARTDRDDTTRRAGRAPSRPEGIVGSMTHGDDYHAAAVARSAEIASKP
jgi:hypothetical protein